MQGPVCEPVLLAEGGEGFASDLGLEHFLRVRLLACGALRETLGCGEPWIHAHPGQPLQRLAQNRILELPGCLEPCPEYRHLVQAPRRGNSQMKEAVVELGMVSGYALISCTQGTDLKFENERALPPRRRTRLPLPSRALLFG